MTKRNESILLAYTGESSNSFCFLPYTGDYISWVVDGDTPPESLLERLLSTFQGYSKEEMEDIKEGLLEEIKFGFEEFPIDLMELLGNAGYTIYDDYISLVNGAVENNVEVKLEVNLTR